jgi:hypothetical protein
VEPTGGKGESSVEERVWNVMAHAQKPDFVFRRNGQVLLNRQGRQFSWLLAAEVCASAVVMLDTPCSEVVWRVLATHSIHQFPLHFPSRASPCTITFHLAPNTTYVIFQRNWLRVSIIRPLYSTKSRYDVMTCQHRVLSLYFWGGVSIIAKRDY